MCRSRYACVYMCCVKEYTPTRTPPLTRQHWCICVLVFETKCSRELSIRQLYQTIVSYQTIVYVSDNCMYTYQTIVDVSDNCIVWYVLLRSKQVPAREATHSHKAYDCAGATSLRCQELQGKRDLIMYGAYQSWLLRMYHNIRNWTDKLTKRDYHSLYTAMRSNGTF